MLPLLTAAATAATGGSQVSLDVTASIPGALSALLSLSMGEPAQKSPWLAVGPEGITVGTAQARVGLSVEIGGTGPLRAVRLRLPILMDIAPADARLADIKCRGLSPESVAVAGTSGIANAWIGDLSPYDLSNLSAASVQTAEIVRAPLLSVTGSSHAGLVDENEETLIFFAEDINGAHVKTISTTTITDSIATTLLRDANLNANVVGLNRNTSAVQGAVASQLGGVAGPIDLVLASVLELIGLGLGEADIQVHGARCGGPGLVG